MFEGTGMDFCRAVERSAETGNLDEDFDEDSDERTGLEGVDGLDGCRKASSRPSFPSWKGS